MRHNRGEELGTRLTLRNTSNDSADLADDVRLLGQCVNIALPLVSIMLWLSAPVQVALECQRIGIATMVQDELRVATSLDQLRRLPDQYGRYQQIKTHVQPTK